MKDFLDRIEPVALKACLWVSVACLVVAIAINLIP